MNYKMENINIFFDTNSIKKINCKLDIFEFNETYKIVKSFIIENQLRNIKVYVPRIVIDELVQQYIKDYKELQQSINDELTKLSVKAARLEWKIKIDKKFKYENKAYIAYIKNQAEKFIQKEKYFLNIVKYPSDSKFNKILQRAILKKKPFFEGNSRGKKFSDAGFKDVVFLESIIEFMEELKENFFIISNDKYFGEVDLKSEVLGSDGLVLSYDTGKEIVEHLKRKLSIEDYSKYIKFVKSKYYKEAIENVLKCNIVKNYVEISKDDNNDDVYIYNTSLVDIDGKCKEIIVKLSEENDLIEIVDKESEVVIYEW